MEIREATEIKENSMANAINVERKATELPNVGAMEDLPTEMEDITKER